MALVIKDRIKETSTTTGTGTLTLAGAVSGFRSFADIGNANTCPYVILEASESAPTAWEVGIGTYTSAGTTLSRDTVLQTSAGNTTKITLASGTHTVFCGWSATDAINAWYQVNRGYTFVRNSSTAQALTGGASTKLTTCLSTVEADPYTWWDTTNKKFTPTRAGNYLFIVSVQTDNSSVITTGQIYLNGSFNQNGSGPYQTTQTPAIVYMNGSTDYVEFYCYVSAGCNTNNNTNTSFKAVYLG